MDSEVYPIGFFEYEKLLDKSIFYTTDEVRELTSMKVPHQIYLKDKDTWNKYNNVAFDRVTVKSFNDPTKLISCSKELLRDILKVNALILYSTTISINNMFNSIMELHDSGLAFAMSYVSEDGKISTPISFKRTELVRLLDEIINKYPNEFDEADIHRFNVLRMNVNPDICKQTFVDDLEYFIDGKKYVIEPSKLLDLLDNKNGIFNKFINGDKNISYKLFENNREHIENDRSIVAYMLKVFIDQNRIFDRFLFDEDVINKYNDMVNRQSINFQTIEKYNRPLDEDVSDKYELSKELIEEVNKYMNPTYNALEKAIHIYIRLCQILSLDDDITSYEQDSKYKLSKIQEKNSKNNKVTRYQFMLIYSKFLSLLGIKYSNYAVGNPDDIRIGFRYGEYDIEINEFGYLSSDISNIKLNNSIECLNSINKNVVIRNKFNETKDKVKSNITINKKKETEFNLALDKYRSQYLRHDVISPDDLYTVFFKSIRREDLVGLDAYTYLKQLFDKTISNLGEVKLDFLSKRKADGFSFTVVALLTKEVNGEFTYAIIDYNQDPIMNVISKDNLERLLNSKEYYFLEENKNLSSYGLESKGRVYNVR